MIEERHVQIDDTRVFYQTAGAGEPVVLIHGLSGSTRWWSRNVAALAERRRVYVVDLIAFGESRGRHRFVLRDAATFLTRWMDRLGLAHTDLVGHSMGGLIAADLAAAYPERVDRLVLVDAATLLPQRSLPRNAVGFVRSILRLPVDFLPLLVSDALKAGPVTLLRATREIVTTNVTERLEQIAAPTLVIWGEHDAMLPLEVAHRLVETIPVAQLAVIEGAGHNPMWDRAERFNEIVLAFLNPSPAPTA